MYTPGQVSLRPCIYHDVLVNGEEVVVVLLHIMHLNNPPTKLLIIDEFTNVFNHKLSCEWGKAGVVHERSIK